MHLVQAHAHWSCKQSTTGECTVPFRPCRCICIRNAPSAWLSCRLAAGQRSLAQQLAELQQQLQEQADAHEGELQALHDQVGAAAPAASCMHPAGAGMGRHALRRGVLRLDGGFELASTTPWRPTAAR